MNQKGKYGTFKLRCFKKNTKTSLSFPTQHWPKALQLECFLYHLLGEKMQQIDQTRQWVTKEDSNNNILFSTGPQEEEKPGQDAETLRGRLGTASPHHPVGYTIELGQSCVTLSLLYLRKWLIFWDLLCFKSTATPKPHTCASGENFPCQDEVEVVEMRIFKQRNQEQSLPHHRSTEGKGREKWNSSSEKYTYIFSPFVKKPCAAAFQLTK